MEKYHHRFQELRNTLEMIEKKIKIQDIQQQIEGLKKASQDASFWDNPHNASQVQKRLATLEQEVKVWNNLKKDVQDGIEMAKIEDMDDTMQNEIEEYIQKIEKRIQEYEIKVLCSGQYDMCNAYLSLYSGAGGDDASDWTQMLMRMYERYCQQQKYNIQQVMCSYGEKGGVKEATFYIQAPYAYGFLKYESGVHRLVRLSPFSSAKLRHTSFALVDVIPEIPLQDQHEEIPTDDIQVDTFRASGPGGQNVNKRDTAVRITHTPTRISASSQSERSQSANRERAMGILKSKLYMLQQKEHTQKIADIKEDASLVQWGSQIRSYVLHPYRMVKDHRTDVEVSDVDNVLNGDIGVFVNSAIRSIIKERN